MQKTVDIKAIFNLVLEHCRKLKDWKEPSDKQIAVMFLGFQGCWDIRQTKLRKSPLPWQGYVKNDGTVDETAKIQCLQSAFCRLFRYHTGHLGNMLGTIINAHQNLGSMCEAFELSPHKLPKNLWRLDYQSDEYKKWEPLKTENKQVERQFANDCDTFCQVFIYLGKKGNTSSIPGDAWRKALGLA